MNIDVPTKFVAEPSTSLKCSICQGLYRDPVISTRCGHTFCRNCATETLENAPRKTLPCPLDQISFTVSDIVSNRAVLAQLEDLLIYCRHGLIRYDSEEDFMVDPNGCPDKIPLGRRQEHEVLCCYALVPCPNSSNHCGKFRKRDLDDHLKVCCHVKCPFQDKGCNFIGTTEKQKEHLPTCQLAGNSVDWAFLSQLEGDDVANGVRNQYLLKAVRNLNERVSQLEEGKELILQRLDQCTGGMATLSNQMEKLTQVVEQMRVTQAAFMRDKLASQSVSDISLISDYSVVKSMSSLGLNSFKTRTRSASNEPSPIMPWSGPRTECWKMPFSFQCTGTFRGHTGTLWALSTRGNHLFSAGADNVIKVWDIADIKNSKGCIQTLKGHKDNIHALCTGRGLLYSTGSDKSLRVWSLDNFRCLRVVEDADQNIICALIYTGKYVISSSHSTIRIWQPRTLELVHTIGDLKHWVRALCLDEKKEKLYSGSHNTIHIWDAVNDFALRGKIDHTHGSVYSLAVTRHYLIMGTYNQNTHLYDINTFRYVQALTGHLGTITAITCAPSGNFAFTASCDSTVQLWDLGKLLPIQVLSRHEASVNCLVLRGDTLYTGSEDREIKVFIHQKLLSFAEHI